MLLNASFPVWIISLSYMFSLTLYLLLCLLHNRRISRKQEITILWARSGSFHMQISSPMSLHDIMEGFVRIAFVLLICDIGIFGIGVLLKSFLMR